MTRTFVLTLSATLLLSLSACANAGGGRHGHHGGHYDGHSDRHYGRHHGRHHRKHDDDGDFVKVAAGALVLGTIIYAISQSEREQAQPVAVAPPPERWYRIDGDGRCVMVHLNGEGREVWTWVDPAYCE